MAASKIGNTCSHSARFGKIVSPQIQHGVFLFIFPITLSHWVFGLENSSRVLGLNPFASKDAIFSFV